LPKSFLIFVTFSYFFRSSERSADPEGVIRWICKPGTQFFRSAASLFPSLSPRSDYNWLVSRGSGALFLIFELYFCYLIFAFCFELTVRFPLLFLDNIHRLGENSERHDYSYIGLGIDMVNHTANPARMDVNFVEFPKIPYPVKYKHRPAKGGVKKWLRRLKRIWRDWGMDSEKDVALYYPYIDIDDAGLL
jgi:hypothetical protein